MPCFVVLGSPAKKLGFDSRSLMGSRHLLIDGGCRKGVRCGGLPIVGRAIKGDEVKNEVGSRMRVRVRDSTYLPSFCT